MKLRKGRANYKIPPVGMMMHAWVGQGGKYRTRMLLQMQPYEKVKELSPNTRGQPRYIGITDRRVVFWPAPDKAYVATLRYYPPAVEF